MTETELVSHGKYVVVTKEVKKVSVKTHEDEFWEYGLRLPEGSSVPEPSSPVPGFAPPEKFDWMKAKKLPSVETKSASETPGFYQKCAKFVQNEIAPRCDKLNIKMHDFPIPPYVLAELIRAEMSETITITRRETRQYLDEVCGIKK